VRCVSVNASLSKESVPFWPVVAAEGNETVRTTFTLEAVVDGFTVKVFAAEPGVMLASFDVTASFVVTACLSAASPVMDSGS
jgi:hypothetical protein